MEKGGIMGSTMDDEWWRLAGGWGFMLRIGIITLGSGLSYQVKSKLWLKSQEKEKEEKEPWEQNRFR